MYHHPGINPAARIHPTAIIEAGVTIGAETRIWNSVHIRRGATIGRSCIIGEKTYIAYEVVIGSHVKLNANVYICAGVRVEDFCMIAAHTVFTNDKLPRAGNVELSGLETSDPTEDTLETLVRRGVTIGANATIGPGITLGEFCMVGMGSVVTQSVPPHQLVAGNPAKFHAWVCVCGQVMAKAGELEIGWSTACGRCERVYSLTPSGLQLWRHLPQSSIPVSAT
jgi:acetyltransferase-like isoleucine patch superfamily enzyme